MLKTSLLRSVEVLGTDGGLEQIEDYQGLDEDEKLVELISVATRKDWEAFEVVDLQSLWGVYSSLSLRMSLLISARRDLLFPLRCL